MRRAALAGLCVVWLAMILACTGAGGVLFDIPGEFLLCKSDYRDYFLQGPGCGVSGHVEAVSFDDQFILLRRNVSQHHDRPKRHHSLTGVIEFYIVEVSPRKQHGPFSESGFAAARKRLGVPADLELEPTDDVHARVQRQQR